MHLVVGSLYTTFMWIPVAVFFTLLVSSLTIVPQLLQTVSDKTSLGYQILLVIFDPIVDGIGLLVSVTLLVFSRKK